MSNTPAVRSIPKLEDLYANKGLAEQQNELNKLLNKNPKKEWVRKHPTVTKEIDDGNGGKVRVPLEYMAVETIEYLLTSIFIKWRLEIKDRQVMANSVVVTVRLHVQDPISNEWDWQDGIGASPMQTNKNAAATDWTQIKSAAVQMAAPAAESYAFKDAAEKFGRLFGKDLNRKDELNYQDTLDKKFSKGEIVPIPDDEREVIKGLLSIDDVTVYYAVKTEYHSNPEFMKLLDAQKKVINGKSGNQ